MLKTVPLRQPYYFKHFSFEEFVSAFLVKAVSKEEKCDFCN